VSLAAEWVTGAAGFEALAEEWEAALPADSLPFDLHCWYVAWWAAFGGAGEPEICTVRRDGALAGAFPLLRDAGRTRPLANVHSPSFRPWASDREALRALASAALERGGRELELIALPAEDSSVSCLRESAAAASLLTLSEPSYASPAVETGGDFESWRKLSKGRWGAPLERFRRKMGRDHEARFEIVRPPADLEAELASGFAVEASGWKGEAGTAIVSRPETEAFYRAIAAAFHERGELRLSRIELDGRVAAFDLCIEHGGRLFLLKTGFDEEFRRLAPGLVMRLAAIEHCFEHGLRSHELLGGESGWKAKFATTSRPHVTLRVYRRDPLRLGRYAYRSAVRPRLKRAYRRIAKDRS
jgi:CelD/BcsL family acetyltransferase involved in cellulose biosynthesis